MSKESNLVRVENLSLKFDEHWALRDLNFSIPKGSNFALVGESGSGKSSLARCLIKLIDATKGQIFFKDQDLQQIKGAELMSFRQKVQMIFQNPMASLHPKRRVFDSLEDPLLVHRLIPSAQKRRERIFELIQRVGLDPDQAQKYPDQFSGGQKQRLGIARALSLNPEFLICDEPVSALDPSIQIQILDLLSRLKKDLGLTLLMITHDLKTVESFCDQMVILNRGQIIEIGKVSQVLAQPKHEWTKHWLNSRLILPDAGL